MKIDLNCDMGELDDAAHEAALMAYITSANIACGGHAGDAQTMERTARLALERGVRIGAHPGYPDRENFGRLEIEMTGEAIAETVYAQIARLDEVVRRVGGTTVHVKPHGALYNVAVRNGEVARAIAEGAARWNAGTTLFGLAGSAMLDVWRDDGDEGGGRGVRGPALRGGRHAAFAQIRRCADYGSGGSGGTGAALRARGPGGNHLRARRHAGLGEHPEGLPGGANIVTMRFLAALAFAVPMFAQNCTFVVNPLSFHISAEATPGLVKVTQTAGSACGNYSATVPVETNWLHITSLPSGVVGDSGVTFTADANPSAAARAGSMVIATQVVTVTQDGLAGCTFGITPTSQSMPVGGGDGTFTVQSNCPWQSTTNVDWIALGTGGTTGTPINYKVAANTCVGTRTGTISLRTNLPSPPTLSVNQDGSPNNMSLSPSSATVDATASNGRITVTTGDVCNWSAVPDVSWIQITVGATGTGSGGISYHLLENTTALRTGSIHVGALTYTITQQAPAQLQPVLSSVGNAASYNTDAVSPGEIVALFGNNMGPASIVTLQVNNGTVINSLAGTQVLFDGVAAPMVYTLKGQVSAVVPYGVAGKTSTQVQVQYQGAASNTVTKQVQAATPAIFSLDSTGVGPGAILNEDTSVNSTGNPAARGSVIALYCTGGGVTTPATTTDGLVIGVPAPKLAAQPPAAVKVTIGGVNAEVQYAGGVPGTIAGFTQINVKVPEVTPGLALPVVVKIGDFASGGSVTVAVK